MPMALPVLHLIEIPQEGLSFSSDVQTDDLGLGPEDVLIPGGLAMSVNALKSGAIVYVTGTLSGTARRQCVRCLKEYDDPLWIPVAGGAAAGLSLGQRARNQGFKVMYIKKETRAVESGTTVKYNRVAPSPAFLNHPLN